MRLFFKSKDGGPESKVWGYWLVEWKRLFSVVLLRFEDGSRDAFHNHAFNAVSWVLSFRGPWSETWREYADGECVTLTHGRREVARCARG